MQTLQIPEFKCEFRFNIVVGNFGFQAADCGSGRTAELSSLAFSEVSGANGTQSRDNAPHGASGRTLDLSSP